jgi:NitT/TauT family transport system permease protein
MNAASDVAAELLPDPAAAEAEFLRRKQREIWRRRLLPAAGILCALCVWAGLVHILKVPPFIAPSPAAVGATLWAKSGLLLANLWPTAVEAICGSCSATSPPSSSRPPSSTRRGWRRRSSRSS